MEVEERKQPAGVLCDTAEILQEVPWAEAKVPPLQRQRDQQQPGTGETAGAGLWGCACFESTRIWVGLIPTPSKIKL